MYHIDFVELDNNKPFKRFSESLTLEEQAKLIVTIDRFLERKNLNLPVKSSLSKYLEDGIFELILLFPNKTARILYYYEKEGQIIITHGFIKKTQKTPRKEIEYAKNLENNITKG